MFSLEPLGPEDFDFRWSVYTATIKPYLDDLIGWTDEQHQQMIRSNLAEGTHAAIVVDGARAGVVQIEETADRISLSQIELLPAFQGQGIGSAIVQRLQERAVAVGKPVELRVFLANTGARRLYERLGFAELERTERDLVMQFRPMGHA
jgi:GNAT superfamily N-acetyltransferase